MQVSKKLWKAYRAGDLIAIADVPPALTERWLNARRFHQRISKGVT